LDVAGTCARLFLAASWPGQDRFTAQKTPTSSANPCALGNADSILFQALHHDPIQVAANEVEQLRRFDTAACGYLRQIGSAKRAQASGRADWSSSRSCGESRRNPRAEVRSGRMAGGL